MTKPLDLTQLRVRFPDGKIDEKLDIRGPKAAANQQRNTLIRFVSDYISESMNIGFGKAATETDKKAFTSVGVSGGALADSIVNNDEFESLTGFRLSEVDALKKGAVDKSMIRLPTGIEAKIKGVGGSAEPDITAISASLSTPEGKRLAGVFGDRVTAKQGDVAGKGLGGAEAINVLFSEPLKPQRDQLILNAQVKFANLLVVDTSDIQKKQGKDIFKVYVNPFKNLSGDAFKNPNTFGKYFQIAIKLKAGSYDKKTGKMKAAPKFRISIKPNAALFADMQKGAKDITEQVSKAHLKVMANNNNKFSQGLLNYLINKKIPDSVQSKEAVNEYLSLIVGFAKEFERGGMTPFVHRTTIETATQKEESFEVKSTIKKGKGQRDTTQKFISAAQMTVMVQRRLGALMPKGPRRGPPLSDNILTERTGRFRTSVAVIPNYRANVIRFFYDPIYKSLIDSARNPDLLVGNTIREVTQRLFARQFSVVRGS